MNNYIFDCGTNMCQGLKKMIEQYKPDNSWFIFSLEANPYTYQHAKKIIEDKYSALNVTLLNKAVWVKDCIKKMTVEYNDIHTIEHITNSINADISKLDLSNENSFWMGGSSNIMEDNFNVNHGVVGPVKEKAVDVECIDFVSFIENHIAPNSNVYIKFDIEGAEYSVINKMLKSPIINNVREITVEWHNHLLKEPYDEGFLVNELTKKSIKIHGHS